MQNVYAAAANYIESFGPVDAALYGAWYTGKAASNAITATANDSIGGYQGGVNFAYNIGDGSQIQLGGLRSEEHTSELQSLMRSSYAVFCLKKKNKNTNQQQ